MKLKNKNKSNQNTSDEELMKFITLGNIDAFNALYNRYKNRLLYYFFRMLGNSEDRAQDFLQEIFYKIIEKPFLFDTRKKFKKWIFSVAHNMCKNEYRRMEVRKGIQIAENIDNYSSNCDSNKNTEHLILRIFEILNNFSEVHRSCFLLRYREGFTVNEIADTLSISEGTVKSRLFYTRKKIEDQMHEKYPEMVDEYLNN